MIVREKPKRSVWFVLLITSLMALFSALSDSDMLRILAMGLFLLSAIWATLYFARIHRLGFTVIVLAIFAVVLLVGGRQQKLPTPLEAIEEEIPPPATTTTAAAPMPVSPAPPPQTKSSPPPAEPETTGTYAVDAMPVIDLAPAPEEKPPEASPQPVVIAPAKPPQYIYMDELTATYHAEGCPQITPAMARAVKAAAMLKKFTPHTCVK